MMHICIAAMHFRIGSDALLHLCDALSHLCDALSHRSLLLSLLASLAKVLPVTAVFRGQGVAYMVLNFILSAAPIRRLNHHPKPVVLDEPSNRFEGLALRKTAYPVFKHARSEPAVAAALAARDRESEVVDREKLRGNVVASRAVL